MIAASVGLGALSAQVKLLSPSTFVAPDERIFHAEPSNNSIFTNGPAAADVHNTFVVSPILILVEALG